MHNLVFKAMSDPTRRKILTLLAKDGPLTAGSVVANFDISGASISHHLSILKEAGLIEATRDKQSIIYSINTTVFQEIIQWIYEMFDEENKHE